MVSRGEQSAPTMSWCRRSDIHASEDENGRALAAILSLFSLPGSVPSLSARACFENLVSESPKLLARAKRANSMAMFGIGSE